MSDYFVLIGSVKSRDYRTLRKQYTFAHGLHIRVVRADFDRLLATEDRVVEIMYDTASGDSDAALKQAVDEAFGVDSDEVVAIIFTQEAYDAYTDPVQGAELITEPDIELFLRLRGMYLAYGDGQLLKIGG